MANVNHSAKDWRDLALMARNALYNVRNHLGGERFSVAEQAEDALDAITEAEESDLPNAYDAGFQDGFHAGEAKWEDRIVSLLRQLEEDGTLSEQQCSKFYGGDLLDWRFARDGAAHPFAQEGTC